MSPLHARLGRRSLVALSVSVLATAGCSTGPGSPGPRTGTGPSAQIPDGRSSEVFDASLVHQFAVEVEEEEYTAMLAEFVESGDKEWITATVTIDGEVFENAGVRLKGNSSLHEVNSDSDPTALSWLIDLGKYEEDQAVDGYTEFVVRSNHSQTSLNEAVALDLLDKTGLASQHAVAARFSLNNSPELLRLVVQHLDETWDAEHFDNEGILYKAEAGGDYAYRGEDPKSYTEAFDQETNKDHEDLAPLIGFLDFINNSSDEEFDQRLHQHLEVRHFATYLAFEDLIANADDISGLGNNSYLRYDQQTRRFTVVAWDHNMAFFDPIAGSDGVRQDEPPTMSDPSPDQDAETPPDDGTPDDGPARDGELVAPPNVLVDRFRANTSFSALYEKALAHLRASLYSRGRAEDVLRQWTVLLERQAADLVDPEAVRAEAQAIRKYFSSGQS